MGFNHYSLLLLALVLLFALAAGYLFRLVILALLKYLRSGEVRKEKAETKKTLGEALKAHHTLSHHTTNAQRFRMPNEISVRFCKITKKSAKKSDEIQKTL